MGPRDAGLAVLVAALWGCNFVAARLALAHVPPLLLVALRFGIAALPAVVLPRPRLAWRQMVAIAATLFVGQFCFLFLGLRAGTPPGLASVLTQAQAILTVAGAALVLGERPVPRQVAGLAVAGAGLLVIGATVGTGSLTPAGLALTLAAAASWAVGNLLLKRVGATDMLALVVWLSLIPPVPALVLSLLVEGPAAMARSLDGDVWTSLFALLYIAVAATLGGYALWGRLLRRYPAGTVAPFALLVPVFGLVSAWLVVGERFGPLRLTGIALVVLGLAVASLAPAGWTAGRRRSAPIAQRSGAEGSSIV